MKKIYLLFTFFILVLMAGCDNSGTGPDTGVNTTAKVYVTSDPAGAQIWMDGTNTNLVTPDTVKNVGASSSGTSHSFTLKLAGYADTTFSVTVNGGSSYSKHITFAVNTTSFGPVRIWETTGTSVDQPSVIDLSSGNAYGVSSSNKVFVDLYYSSSGFVLKSADDINSRVSDFFVGSGSGLTDGEAAPAFVASGVGGWTDRVSDSETNYFYVYDEDRHFSKMKITNRGGGTGFDPAWVEVTWIYNKTINSRAF